MTIDYGQHILQKQFNLVMQSIVPIRTYKLKLVEYSKSEDKENWSPTSKRRHGHRVLTDSTEKQAVEQLIEQHISKQKACSNSDMSKQ